MMGEISNSPRPANVAEIEDQLRDLWRDLGDQHRDANHVMTRVCTMTVIGYGANQELAKRIRTALPQVFGVHPCRAILIETANEPEELSAWVSTVCQPSSEEHEQVCCEQITFAVGEQMRRRLPGTVLPLVVSDLPLFVWWPGPLHPASNVRTQLFAHADRWIMDSADFLDPLPDLARLNTMMTSDQTDAVSDLTWARLTPWRTAFAQIFDAMAMRPVLEHISSIKVTTGRHQAAGLLSIGWIATCLDWQLVSASGNSETLLCNFKHRNGTVTISMQTSDRTGEEVPFIELQAAKHKATITVGRSSNKQALLANLLLDTETRCQMSELPNPSDSLLLLNELNMYSHDRVYERALAIVAAIAQATDPHGAHV
ncbi:glucose-6-phosphate dehydrogenase assembly protein OpcA [Herpetosiphon llansteffanensis]|uniref:glucose-6-phosphate dehydrogenase assembly protein OpcA n=1 Tax=Herpetosiphon llansteffanensis TaxID=2094568 RepID=UPI000D7C1A7E|nr:glucose-6-phosphate dehydrogenase assembly protein OpcA [Herpetosiphon llansteffanensis]